MKPFVATIITLLLIYNISMALSDYLNTIPNGTYVYTSQKSKCQICHEFYAPSTSQSQLNPFGTDYRNCGKTWGSCLGTKDSDGDGYFNYQELNCSNYSWAAYSGPCGSSFDHATNPGDATIAPSISTEKKSPALKGRALLAAVPNPFNPRTTLHFSLPDAAPALISILTPEGKTLRTFTLTAEAVKSGSLEWNGMDALARDVSAGVYIARLVSGRTLLSTRLFLTR